VVGVTPASRLHHRALSLDGVVLVVSLSDNEARDPRLLIGTMPSAALR
jgi:hypothetical protein